MQWLALHLSIDHLDHLDLLDHLVWSGLFWRTTFKMGWGGYNQRCHQRCDQRCKQQQTTNNYPIIEPLQIFGLIWFFFWFDQEFGNIYLLAEELPKGGGNWISHRLDKWVCLSILHIQKKCKVFTYDRDYQDWGCHTWTFLPNGISISLLQGDQIVILIGLSQNILKEEGAVKRAM